MFPRSVRRALGIAVLGLVACASSASGLTVPAGFSVEDVTPSAVWDTPVAIAYLPDGRMLVAEKAGLLWATTNGVKPATPMWDGRQRVLDQHDRGFLGLAVDPNYFVNHFVYVMYTVDPDSNGVDDEDESFGRLERYRVNFTDSSAFDLSSRVVLFGTKWSDGPLIASPSHTIGCLRFGRDGTLLASMGDGSNFDQVDAGGLDPNAFLPGRVDPYQDVGSYRSQQIRSLCGKVLRLDPATGHGLPSNPYWDGNASSVRSRVWAYGMRNPFRFCVRPGTGSTNPALGRPGHILLGDVGWYQFEEVNVIRNGGENLGWPCYEGVTPTNQYSTLPQSLRALCDSLGTPGNPAASFTSPLMVESHSGEGLSIPPTYIGNCAIGGQFYTGTIYPAAFRGKYFALDYGASWMKVVDVDTLGHLNSLTDFGTGFGGPVDCAVEPQTGDLVYISINANRIYRLRYTGGQQGNLPPVVNASGLPDFGVAPMTVNFSSTGTYDDNGDTLAYSWNFGDQSGSPLANPTHVYTIPGDYSAVLTVDDGHGGVNSDSVHISVASTTSFPTTGVLDDFNRPNGALGGLWVGDVTGMQIVSGQMKQVQFSNSTVLNTAPFGPTQEGYVTMAHMTPQAPEHNLMLKVQGLSWDTGHIEVHYDGPGAGVVVSTYSPGEGWVQRAPLMPVTLQDGDQFGARAYPNGLVVVYKNGVQLGTADCSGWVFHANGGRLGMTLTGASQSLLDNFGGGNAVLNVNSPPGVQILRPDTTWAVAGDTLHLACSASDAQQPDSTLAYRWDVDIHHNNHIHPSVYTSTVKTGQYLVGNHDDGTGVFFRVRVRVTDSGTLTAADTVYVFPEIDLTPQGLSMQPATPNDAQPTAFTFWLRNLGRMPAQRSRWRVVLDGATAGEGDTLVAANDSLQLAVTVPALAAGSHTLRIVADTLAGIVETNEGNNALTQTFSVAIGVLDAGAAPRSLALSGAWPNPATGRTSFTLDLPRDGNVEMSVLDLQGRRVWSAPSRTFGAGRWTLVWPGTTSTGGQAPAGLYLVRVRVADREFTRRFVLLQ